MESEKVKEIKKALEQNDDNGIMYEVNDIKRTCKFIHHKDILTLINELECENERLRTCREADYKTMTALRQANTELNECMDEMQDRIAELEGEITKLDIINSKLEMDIELLNKQNIDLEIDRDYYQEQFNEQEDFYVEWNKQQLKQFAERLVEKFYYVFGNEYEQSVSGFDTKVLIEYIDETLKEFIND